MTELDAITAIGLGTVADCHRDKLITSQIGRRAAKGRKLSFDWRAAKTVISLYQVFKEGLQKSAS
jgi:hypothetical protein